VRRLAVAALAVATPLAASAAPRACDPDIAEIVTAGGAVAFRVEIADTPDEHAQGLMHRTNLPRDAGMLFLFPRAEPRAFWMKNTPLPLDMLFFGADGRLCGVVARAEPFTETPRLSGCEARAVLEINGGLAETLGLRPGDALRHPAFGPGTAAPCG
jgi:uncharacterized membrane protein (UPF0127 family)